MEFEKIKLALALKDLEIQILKGATVYVGYLNKLDESVSPGYKESVRDFDGYKLVRVGATKDDVAEKLYKWIIANEYKVA